VIDYSNTKLVERELLLVKVSILGAEHLHEQMPIDIIRDENVDMVEEAVSIG
jgi:acetolactate synthase I/III small subunit